MNRPALQDIWRSEAFAEDLFDDTPAAAARSTRLPVSTSMALCAVPVLVALLGGVLAFLHTVG